MLDSLPAMALPYGLPYHEILSLIAPRPLFEVTGTEDPVNFKNSEEQPLPSVEARMKEKREAHSRARAIYELYGSGDRLERFEFDGGHVFPLEARKAAYAWLKRWLMD